MMKKKDILIFIFHSSSETLGIFNEKEIEELKLLERCFDLLSTKDKAVQ